MSEFLNTSTRGVYGRIHFCGPPLQAHYVSSFELLSAGGGPVIAVRPLLDGFTSRLVLLAAVNVIGLYLRVERRRIQTQQPGGAGLVAAGLVEGPTDEIYLKPFHFIVEINASGKIDLAGHSFGAFDHFEGELGIAHFGAKTLDGDLVARRDHDRPLDNIFEFPDVSRIVIILQKGEHLG